MTTRLMYDVLLESPGLLRSREVRGQFSSTLAEGERVRVEGREWVVTKVTTPTRPGIVDRHAVARPLAPSSSSRPAKAPSRRDR